MSFNPLYELQIDKHKIKFFLTRPQQVKNINIYLEPLIEELKTLWRGVEVHDASKAQGLQDFTLRGIATWTIHDHPRLSLCSGKLFEVKFSFYSQCTYKYY